MSAVRNTYYDSLRGIAIIAVVFIHCISFSEKSTLNISISFRQLINFAVPLFLAISGFFLAEKNLSDKKSYFYFLKKQIKRVYLPYLIWSSIFVLFLFLISGRFQFFQIIKKILLFQVSPVYYYVALIIQYYFLIPILKFNIRLSLIISILISSTLAVLFTFIHYKNGSSLPLLLYAGNCLTWLMFFVLGMFIKLKKIRIKNTLLVGGILFALILSIAETFFWMNNGMAVKDAVSAVKLSSFVYSAFIIILLLNTIRNWKVLSKLGEFSYAVYLMHMIVLIFLKTMMAKHLDFNFIQELLLGIVILTICYSICGAFSMINSKIAKKYLGI